MNFYFQNGIPGGRGSEQRLHEDLILECLKIYGFQTYYLTREEVNRDMILNEDPLNSFENAYPIEMYLDSISGFEGEGQLLTKFGLEIRDYATFMVSKRRWDELVGRRGKSALDTRPTEGDVIYFPLTKSFFEIRKVHDKNPFFQVGRLYVFRLECELMQYSSEDINTGYTDIDEIASAFNMDVTKFGLVLAGGGNLLLNTESQSNLILNSYDLKKIDKIAQNSDFASEALDVLDFSETNPFGDTL